MKILYQDVYHTRTEKRKFFMPSFSVYPNSSINQQIVLEKYYNLDISVIAYTIKFILSIYAYKYDRADYVIASIRSHSNWCARTVDMQYCYTTDKFSITELYHGYNSAINGTFEHGKPHSINDLPIISLDEQTWYSYGFKHRLNGPAHISISMYLNKPCCIKYYQYGLLHNSNGPAIQYNSLYACYACNEWYFRGIALTKDEYYVIIKWYKLYQSIIEHLKFM